MEFNWVVILYFLFLIDSMGAILVAWFGRKWWTSASGAFGRWFPPAKGWAMMYLILVLVIGYLLGIL